MQRQNVTSQDVMASFYLRDAVAQTIASLIISYTSSFPDDLVVVPDPPYYE